MKTTKYILIFAVSCFLLLSFAQLNYNPFKNSQNDFNNTVYNVLNLSSEQMNANNISTWYRNNGSFNRNPSTDN